MNEQIDCIRRAYDLTVEQYNEEIDTLAKVPEEFKNSLKFKAMQQNMGPLLTGSNAPEIKEYLDPKPGMRFLDAGCCANLAN